MAHEVFLRFASRDARAATEVGLYFERKGIGVWMAPRDIAPSAPRPQQIARAIHAARVMVLFLSEALNWSPQIKREVEDAVQNGVPVLLVRMTDIEPNELLGALIDAKLRFDAFGPLDQHLESLAAMVGELLASSASPVMRREEADEFFGDPQTNNEARRAMTAEGERHPEARPATTEAGVERSDGAQAGERVYPVGKLGLSAIDFSARSDVSDSLATEPDKILRAPASDFRQDAERRVLLVDARRRWGAWIAPRLAMAVVLILAAVGAASHVLLRSSQSPAVSTEAQSVEEAVEPRNQGVVGESDESKNELQEAAQEEFPQEINTPILPQASPAAPSEAAPSQISTEAKAGVIEPSVEAATPMRAAGRAPITGCDRLAASPDDLDRISGVNGITSSKNINVDAAVSACQQATTMYPSERRLAFQLGRALYAAKRYKESIAALARAEAAGSASAANTLGIMYLNGLGIEKKDEHRAALYYEKAARAGVASAMCNLAKLYLLGVGVRKDARKAAALLKHAAESGSPEAKYDLGMLYLAGDGVAKNKDEAQKFFRQAAKAGSNPVALALKRIQEHPAP